MVVIGHVDAGKSTLMGHLLYDIGRIDRKVMRQFEKESNLLGKSSFKYAWVLDENEEERSRGVTMEVGSNFFETEKRVVTLLDAPGHRDFIPSMITGVSRADVAILVVPASRGEFEAGFSSDGQTKEHASLALNLGVHQLVIAVNKLDTVDWDEARFAHIREVMTRFLTKVGWDTSKLTFVPVSGLVGTNVARRPTAADSSELTKWYDGPSLVECIDRMEPRVRLDKKPFRMYLADVIPSGGKSTVIVSGKIQAGSVARGDRCMLMPLMSRCKVKAVTLRRDGPVSFGAAGENVDITLVDVDPQLVEVGYVLCSIARPIPVATTFRVKMRTLNRLRTPIIKGQRFVLHMQCFDVPAIVGKMIRTMDASGKTLTRKPRCLMKNSFAVVDITSRRPLCIETNESFPGMGRFVLRDRGVSVAACEVIKIKPRR